MNIRFFTGLLVCLCAPGFLARAEAAEDPALYFNRGNAAYEEGDYDRAIGEWTEAIRLEPLMAAAYYNRGYVYSLLGDLEESIGDFSIVITLEPDNADAYTNRGMVYYLLGAPDRAAADYTRVMELETAGEDLFYNRGLAYQAAGDPGRALEDFSQAIVLNPNWDYPYNSRGMIYFSRGELDRAIGEYTRAVTLNPRNGPAYSNRGNAYYQQGNMDWAVADYTQAISLNPRSADTYSNRGEAWRALGDYDRALADYDRAIELSPEHGSAFNNRGMVWLAQGDYDRALADFNQAVLLNPQYHYAYHNRGLVYAALGDYDQAIAGYTQALDLEPGYHYAYMSRGQAYWALGERERAREDFSRSIEAADGGPNILDISFRAWEFAGALYRDYPFLNGDLEQDDEYALLLADMAREALARSAAGVERAPPSPGLRAPALLAERIYQFYAGVDLEARFGSVERAFAYSQGLRSRDLLAGIGTREALRLPGLSDGERIWVRELIREAGELEALLAGLDPWTAAEKYAGTMAALRGVEQELAAVDRELGDRVPGYGALRRPSPVDLARAQAFCGEDRAILEFVIWDQGIEYKNPVSSAVGPGSFRDRPEINSYCIVLTQNKAVLVRLDLSPDYAILIEVLRTLVAYRPGTGPGAPVPEFFFEAERNALYRALIKPALEHIPPGVRDIIIIPDGNLAFLPFDMLREDAAAPDFGESYRLSLSPSVSVSILAAGRGEREPEPFLGFGGSPYNGYYGSDAGGQPLFWPAQRAATLELLSIKRRFTRDPLVLTGSDAGEARLKALSAGGLLARYGVIHLTGWCYFDPLEPGRRGLLLPEISGSTGDSGEDGLLTPGEALWLDLDARMVMLSAGSGGMTGLGGAFLAAGARAVGAVLWETDDWESYDFMCRLYRLVDQDGLSFRDALYEVKRQFRREARYSHPRCWASYVMYQ